MTDCPSRSQLYAHVVGDLDSKAILEIEKHIVGCRKCKAQLLELKDQFAQFVGKVENRTEGDVATRQGSDRSESPQDAKRIGPYRLLQQIGEGGMGTIWMADQLHPIRRRVALKVIKSGMNSKKVIARFEAERQALALMDHQNIARIFDGGSTDDGCPYFAMELVKGTPLVKYCDQNKLSLDQRLELFESVCQAVQHAHQKGVIHRDIKPANILVANYDGKPVAKVIDFGLAKALGNENALTNKTLFTRFDQVIGTPQYMSPEQSENAQDIDTRTDIYSLGIVLYELLTGSTPIEKSTTSEKPMHVVLELVREATPPRPSLRLSRSSNTIGKLSSKRNIDSQKLRRRIAGDLDWIVMKAIEKDRERRYASSKDFGDDIARYLDGEAIQARPPTISYLLTKAWKKHRLAFLAVSTVMSALIAGIIGMTWGMMLARNAEIRATENANEAVNAKMELYDKVTELQANESELQQKNADLKFQRFTGDVEQNLNRIKNGVYSGQSNNILVEGINPSIDTYIVDSLQEPIWRLANSIVVGDWEIVDFSREPSGNRLAICDASGQIHVVDPNDQTNQISFGTHYWRNDKFRTAHWKEKYLDVDSDISLRPDDRIDYPDPQLFLRIWWLDETNLLAVSERGGVYKINLAQEQFKELASVEAGISVVEFDGKQLFAVSRSGVLLKISLVDGSMQPIAHFEDRIDALIFESKSETVYLATDQGEIVSVAVTADKPPVSLGKIKFLPFCLAIVEDASNSLLFVGGLSRSLAFFDLKSNKKTISYCKIEGIQRIDDIFVDSASRHTFVYDGEKGIACKLDRFFTVKERMSVCRPNYRQHTLLDKIDLQTEIDVVEKERWRGQILVFNDGGEQTILTAGQSASVDFWYPNKNRLGEPAVFKSGLDEIRAVDFVANNDHLIWLFGLDGTLSVFDLEQRKVVDQIVAHQTASHLFVSNELKITCTAGRDSQIRFWEFDDGKIRPSATCKTIEAKNSKLVGFDVDSTGTYLAVTDLESNLHLFDIKTGRLMARQSIEGGEEDRRITLSGKVAFEPNSQYVAAFGAGQTMGVFTCPSLEPQKAIAEIFGLGGIDLAWGRGTKKILLACDNAKVRHLQPDKNFERFSPSSPFRQEGQRRRISSIHQTNDGQRLVLFEPNGNVNFLESNRLRNLLTLNLNISNVVDGAVNRDCNSLIAVNRRGVISLTRTTNFSDKHRISKVPKRKWRSLAIDRKEASFLNLFAGGVVFDGDSICMVVSESAENESFKETFRNPQYGGGEKMLSNVYFYQSDGTGVEKEVIRCFIADTEHPSRYLGANHVSLRKLNDGNFAAVFSLQKEDKSPDDREVRVAKRKSDGTWNCETAVTYNVPDSISANSGFNIQILSENESGIVTDFLHFTFNGYHLLHSRKLKDGNWTTGNIGRQGDGHLLINSVQTTEGQILVTAGRIRFPVDFVSFRTFVLENGKMTNISQSVLPQSLPRNLMRMKRNVLGDVFWINQTNSRISELELQKYHSNQWETVSSFPVLPSSFLFFDYVVSDDQKVTYVATDRTRKKLLFLHAKQNGFLLEPIWETDDPEEFISNCFVGMDAKGREIMIVRGTVGDKGSWLREFRRTD